MKDNKHNIMSTAIDKYKSLPVQVRAAFWFLLCSFMQKGISSLTAPIFTRLLTTAEYGQFSVYSSWLSLLTPIVSLNLYYGVYMQGLVKYENEKKIYSSSLQGLNLVLCLIWTVIYLAFHNFWNGLFSMTTVQMLSILIMIWTTGAFGFWSAYQRVDFKYRNLVLVTVIISIAKPVVGIVFVLFADDKVTARILGLLLVEVIGYTGLCIKQLYDGKKFFVWEYWKHAMLFNLPLIPHYISNTVLSSTDRIMINNMIGADEAGIYSLAYSISLIMTLFNTALQQTLEPYRYKKLRDNKAEDIEKILYPTLILIALLNLVVIVFAPEVVAIFAPASYYNAIWIIPPVSMSAYLMFAYGYFAVFEFYYEKTKYVMIATTSAAVLNIILNYVFIRMFGYYVAGYTTLVCYIVYSFAHYLFMRKICRERLEGRMIYNMKKIIIISCVFMVVGFTMLFLYPYTMIRYALAVLALVLLYVKRKTVKYYLKQLIDIRREEKNVSNRCDEVTND